METKPQAESARGCAVDWCGGWRCIRGHVTCHCCVSPVSRVTCHVASAPCQCLYASATLRRPDPRPPLLAGHSSSRDPPVADMCETCSTLSDNVVQY